ncbi:MAG: TIGR02099 family protein [Gammaproteobacteria bacterium]|nr:TIGR02099 family protein [Gammaproteobacteria bacterium]
MLKKIIRIIWYFIAFLIVLMAVLMTLARLFTPLLNQHRDFFEKWASDFLNHPVKIEKLRAEWAGFDPDLMFKHLAIYDQQNKKVLFQIQNLHININVIKSLLTQKISPSTIKISGVHLVIHQLDKQQFRINGITYISHHEDLASPINAQQLIAWLLMQPRLTLEDVRVNWESVTDKIADIHLEEVNLLNTPDQHALYGSAILTQDHESAADFALLLKGDLNDHQHLTAYFYTYLKNVELSTWASYLKYDGYQIQSGRLNGKFWLAWKSQDWNSVQSALNIDHLVLQGKKELLVRKLQGNFLWQPKDNGWQLSGDEVQLILDRTYPWMRNKFIFETQKQHLKPVYKLWVEHLDLADLRKWMVVDPQLISDKTREIITALNPSGYLAQTFFSNADADSFPYQFATFFKGVTFSHWKHIPGVQNLSGQILVSPDHGSLILDTQNSILDFGTLFPNPLQWNILQGRVDWQKQEDGNLEFNSQDLFGINDHVALYGQMNLLMDLKTPIPVLNLLAGFDVDDSTQVSHYLPVGILGKNVVNWLDQAFVRGNGASGTVIIQGPMNRFPFDYNEGTFIVDSTVRDTDLNYAQNWPIAKNINASLIFSGRSMNCMAQSGSLYDSKVTKLQASIPYMGHEKTNWLYLEGIVDGLSENFLSYIKHSPLNKTIGQDLAPLNVTGKANLSLKLDIPLEDADKTKINGQIQFFDNQLELPVWKLMLNALSGSLNFTEHGFSSEGITAHLLGNPTTFKLETVKPNHTSSLKPFTRITFDGHLNFKNLFDYLKIKQPKVISGESDYQAQLDLHTAKGDTQQNFLKIQSHLSGVAIDVPAPLKKEQNESVSSQLAFYFGENQPVKAKFNLGERYSLATIYKKLKDQYQLFSSNLHLGSSNAVFQDQPGLYIDGFLPTLDWQKYLNTQNQTELLEEFTFPIKLRAIDLKLGTVDLFGQTLTNTLFSLKLLEEGGWALGLDGAAVKGQIRIPKNLKTETISGVFDRLYLNTPGKEGLTYTDLDPGKIPSLDIRVQDFKYGKYQLNGIHLVSYPAWHSMHIKSLNLYSKPLSGNLSGSWSKNIANQYFSHIQGNLMSRDIIELFKMLDIHSSLRGTTGEASLDFKWPGNIYQPNVNEISGQANVDLGKGVIINLGESTTAKLDMGRILNLLSINNLIFMNFNNLSGKGYNFDKMHANFNFSKGLITASHWYFDGSIAHIDMKGTINLIQKTQSLRLAVTPYVTSSLPALATILGGPIAGVVTWVADKLIGKEIGKLIQYHYQVTGTFEKPIVTELKRTAPVQTAKAE